jgi:hypothetical protein
MWNAVAHLAGPTLLTAAIAVLGTSVRAVFRYPYMWRYLEFRYRRSVRPPCAPVRCRRSRCCQRRTRQRQGNLPDGTPDGKGRCDRKTADVWSCAWGLAGGQVQG